ncbi:hypothetical protein B0G84_2309 [Paraburkholderia sp. BL8N3]|nr:hypothetical protein [Paraburkholderia sp. BL8N3]TCK43961.1 hypothetical protein B0G84_2309 [Paraburkholderia sp. BL8N3]
MKFPEFDSPTLAELREWWHKHPDTDVRSLILEVQSHRLELLETRELFDEGFRQLAAEHGAITAAGTPLSKARVRLAIEIRRAGEIDDTPKRPPAVVDFQKMGSHGTPSRN